MPKTPKTPAPATMPIMNTTFAKRSSGSLHDGQRGGRAWRGCAPCRCRRHWRQCTPVAPVVQSIACRRKGIDIPRDSRTGSWPCGLASPATSTLRIRRSGAQGAAQPDGGGSAEGRVPSGQPAGSPGQGVHRASRPHTCVQQAAPTRTAVRLAARQREVRPQRGQHDCHSAPASFEDIILLGKDLLAQGGIDERHSWGSRILARLPGVVVGGTASANSRLPVRTCQHGSVKPCDG